MIGTLPVVYAGGGIALGDAVQDLRDFVEASAIPTVMTLRGLGALPAHHPQSLGMLGMHGTRAANMAVQESDLLVVVGARFDDRATGHEKFHLPLSIAALAACLLAGAGLLLTTLRRRP